jgi:hypothetical protein
MERIALADEFFELIEKGIKRSTIRYKKRNYQCGDCEFYSETSEKTVKVKIENIEYKTFNELTEEDAIQDGFKSLNELKSVLKEFYPHANDKDDVTSVIFSKL